MMKGLGKAMVHIQYITGTCSEKINLKSFVNQGSAAQVEKMLQISLEFGYNVSHISHQQRRFEAWRMNQRVCP